MNIIQRFLDTLRRNRSIVDYYRSTANMDDASALAADWKMVGEDIQKVLDEWEGASAQDFVNLENGT